MKRLVAFVLVCLAIAGPVIPRLAAASATAPLPGNPALDAYFAAETAHLAAAAFDGIRSRSDWESRRPRLHAELQQMLGLDPAAPRPALEPVVTGRIEREDFQVEMLHFQSLPGLYVTANLYLPRPLPGQPVPAVLYVCGHALVMTNGISYGNKTGYQHHGSWFARNGYACLMIDTIQLGEIQGLHHGTHRAGQWWWNARGYTPAGVEAWNAIRALDYLESRPGIDRSRLGVTGRSGGGAYSWFAAALDERVKVAAPVAGITDLQNHVVDGCVTGPCDCMYFVNTFRWDYPLLAALVAPRPLLIANTDKDSIFPLDGVVRTHGAAAKIYGLMGASKNLGLLITEGPHKDTQDLQVPVLRWFNRHLKQDETPVRSVADRLLTPQELKVFAALPPNERVTRIQETFVGPAPPSPLPATREGWVKLREDWMGRLRETVFRGWPVRSDPPALIRMQPVEASGFRFTTFAFESQPNVPLRLYLLERVSNRPPAQVTLAVLDPAGWTNWLASMGGSFGAALREEQARFPSAGPGRSLESLLSGLGVPEDGAIVWFAPRHVGLDRWHGTDRDQVHIRRRFMLLGQTLDSMRVWDIRSALQSLKAIEGLASLPLTIRAGGPMAVNALYAALFEAGIRRLDLQAPPWSHASADAPDYLNVLRVFDIPQAAAIVAEQSDLRLHGSDPDRWIYPRSVAARLEWRPAALQFGP